ncbi:hypothetical protein [uncultured Catenibacterium sp.]|uniref:hypothetical protein n=1 Tax=uncultured Catenibacterium sp. TaxID=286142 RepID=UPI0025916D10|nr:hypothetical protein [uncultured Catenibacterium sp.]
MIQFVLIAIRDMISSIFLYKYLNLNGLFICVSTMVCLIETTLLQYIQDHYSVLPFVQFFTLFIIILLFKKRLTFNDILGASLVPELILVIEIGVFTLVKPMKIIGMKPYILLCYLLSDILILFTYILISYYISKTKKMIVLNNRFLLSIWLVSCFVFYLFGESIILENFTCVSTFCIVIGLLILSVLLFILLYKTQKENDMQHTLELLNKKEIYLKKNTYMMKKIYMEVSEIEHSNIYSFMYIKWLLQTQNYDDIKKFLDENIYKSKKIQQTIHTENQYFNYKINKLLKYIGDRRQDTKIIVSNKDCNFYIDENILNDVINMIIVYFDASNRNYSLNIDIMQKSNYIIFTIMNDLTEKQYRELNDKLKIVEGQNEIMCRYKEINKYGYIKMLFKVEIL